MRKVNIILSLIGTCVLTPLSISAEQAETNTPKSQQWEFDVFLDDKLIGSHHFIVESKGNETIVNSHAKFTYKILGIPLYRYQHDDLEHWENGCLTKISAETNDNGDQLFVKGEQGKEQFLIDTHTGKTRLPKCIQTFAYWDKSLLKQDKLLNSQTGEYLPVTTSSVAIDDGSNPNAKNTVRINANEIDILLIYQANHWQGLKSMTKDDQNLVYQIKEEK